MASKRMSRIATAILRRNAEPVRPDRSHTEIVVTVDDDRITSVYRVGEEAEAMAYQAGAIAVGKRASQEVMVFRRYHGHGADVTMCDCDAPVVWRNAAAVTAMHAAGYLTS